MLRTERMERCAPGEGLETQAFLFFVLLHLLFNCLWTVSSLSSMLMTLFALGILLARNLVLILLPTRYHTLAPA
jgi:hypothetical protein